jgi:transcriptional regulator with XRE-family HTH domain
MDPKKVGNLIKEIRKNNNLTQKALADKYGVTYQAVSKWENGTNLPDISLIKEICNDYNIDVNDFLDGNNIQNKSNKNNKIYVLIGLLIIVVLFGIIYFAYDFHRHNQESSIDLKKITTTCDTFRLSGNLAYDNKISSIRISEIEYCGGDDSTKYVSITCTLKENDNVIYTCDEKKDIKLEDYLKTISIKVDNYKQTCKIYKEDTLMLSIEAKDKDNKTISYKIPLHLDDEC